MFWLGVIIFYNNNSFSYIFNVFKTYKLEKSCKRFIRTNNFLMVQAIQEQIVSCDYEGASFDVMSFAAQSCNTSSEDGAFIMVTGFLTCKDKQVRRRFVQSLYLARRQDRSYAIVNDFLRYIDSIPALPSVPESGKQLYKLCLIFNFRIVSV